jgi:hypothetical protein
MISRLQSSSLLPILFWIMDLLALSYHFGHIHIRSGLVSCKKFRRINIIILSIGGEILCLINNTCRLKLLCLLVVSRRSLILILKISIRSHSNKVLQRICFGEKASGEESNSLEFSVWTPGLGLETVPFNSGKISCKAPDLNHGKV